MLIFIEKEKENSFPITIFNSDGGEVSACGNGSRCVAYLLSKNLNANQIKLKTSNRVLNAKIVDNLMVELEMGKPLFDFKDIPISKIENPADVSLDIKGKKFTGGFCLNVGNPHIVFFVDDCFKYVDKVFVKTNYQASGKGFQDYIRPFLFFPHGLGKPRRGWYIIVTKEQWNNRVER